MRIFAARLRNNGKLIDNTGKDNEVKKKRKSVIKSRDDGSWRKKIRDCNFRVQNTRARKQEKSGRRMPRLSEARKDVVSCEKRRGTANR